MSKEGEEEGGMTGSRGRTRALHLKRVYATPFPGRAGRLPLGQASKREEAGLSVTGYPRNRAPLPESSE